MSLHDALLAKAFSGNGGGGSSGTPIDVTAEVGQTIIVKEVDASGKPTKWESAEYQPRTHWSEEGKVNVSVLPKYMSEMNSLYGFFTFVMVFNEYVESLPLTSIYSIEYDGVEYKNLATVELQGSRFFGNLYFLNDLFGTSFGNTGEPFLLTGDSSGMMMFTLDQQATIHSMQIYVDGTKHHRIDSCYRPEIPVIDLTAYTLTKQVTSISGDDYYDKVYRVLLANDMVKIIYTDGENIHMAVVGTVRSSTHFVNVRVDTYSQTPGLMIFATDSVGSLVLI